MAGKFIICFVAAFALIQPFNTLPAADNKQEVIYRNSKGEYYTSNGVILTDQYPIYWRHNNAQEPKKDHVIIVEPTITYTRQAEYSSTQTAPPTTTFRASPQESQANFRPYDGRTDGSSAVGYYPYYIRAASSDRIDNDNKRIVIDTSDPAYQRFVPRDGTTRDDRGQTWYYYSDGRQQQTSSSLSSSSSSSSQAPPQQHQFTPQPSIASRSTARFYFANGTAIDTHYTHDNKQVLEIHPNQYVIQVNELTTTTTPQPVTTDCPPFMPCNRVVYQQTTQCCKCYLVPSRCCPCTYPNQKK